MHWEQGHVAVGQCPAQHGERGLHLPSLRHLAPGVSLGPARPSLLVMGSEAGWCGVREPEVPQTRELGSWGQLAALTDLLSLLMFLWQLVQVSPEPPLPCAGNMSPSWIQERGFWKQVWQCYLAHAVPEGWQSLLLLEVARFAPKKEPWS